MTTDKQWAPKTLPCPLCGKDVSLTSTGKFWSHTDLDGEVCPIGGEHPRDVPYEGELLVKAAKQIAFEVHFGDKDKAGDPYHHHLTQAAMGVRVFGGPNHVAMAAAYLHDSIEDHPAKVSQWKLANWGIPAATIDAVVACTKSNGQNQEDFLAQVIAGGEDSILVNLGDTLSNVRPDRLAKVKAKLGESVVNRLLKKYRPRIARLLMELGVIADKETQAKLATVPVGSTGGSYTTSSDGTPSWFQTTSLVGGDWPAGWSSPIQSSTPGTKSGESGKWCTLADGKQVFAAHGFSWMVWTSFSLKGAKKAFGAKWDPSQEQQMAKSEWDKAHPKKSTVKVHSGPSKPPSDTVKPTTNESICGQCGEPTKEIVEAGRSRWAHAKQPSTGWHAVVKPTAERLEELLDSKIITGDMALKYAVNDEPLTLSGEEGLCGTCGEYVTRNPGYVTWVHVVPPDPYHLVTAYTEDRHNRLVEAGYCTDGDAYYIEDEDPDESICGECGQLTKWSGSLSAGGFRPFNHVESPTPFHSARRPTKERLDVLVKDGVITQEEADRHLYVSTGSAGSDYWSQYG